MITRAQEVEVALVSAFLLLICLPFQIFIAEAVVRTTQTVETVYRHTVVIKNASPSKDTITWAGQ